MKWKKGMLESNKTNINKNCRLLFDARVSGNQGDV